MSRIYSSRVRSGVNANWRCAPLSAQVVGQLARQVFIESAILAVFGAIAGVLLALWGLDAIRAISPAGSASFAPSDVTRFQEANLDFKVLAFTAAVAIGTEFVGWRLARLACLAHRFSQPFSPRRWPRNK